MNVLEGKVAIVTGASSGIGRAMARLFADEGAAVVATARRQAELDSLVSEIEASGGQAISLAGDVREESHAKAIVDLAVDRFGGLDIAFNNAGTLGEMGPVSSLSMANWRDTLDVNLTSAFVGAKEQIPRMAERGSGSVIFTSTFVGYSAGLPGMAAYAASKAGLIGLMQVLAVEFAAQGIRVNAILPGGTDTPMAPEDPGYRTFAENLHALKRLARPEEIASDASSFMTGVAMLVDGGVSINRT
jgi:NAD(P)-dependent dehydrogenase (short-subunit alcohol dehydrogenase family)